MLGKQWKFAKTDTQITDLQVYGYNKTMSTNKGRATRLTNIMKYLEG